MALEATWGSFWPTALLQLENGYCRARLLCGRKLSKNFCLWPEFCHRAKIQSIPTIKTNFNYNEGGNVKKKRFFVSCPLWNFYGQSIRDKFINSNNKPKRKREVWKAYHNAIKIIWDRFLRDTAESHKPKGGS